MLEKEGYVIGIDIGGTKIAAGLVDKEGKVFFKLRREVATCESAEDGINLMLQMTEELISQTTKDKILGIGIGAAGPLNRETGVLILPPNLPNWHNLQLVTPFQERFGLKTMLENDANAAALGEFVFGAGKGAQDMIYITVSTGIGGGLILNGQLYHGHSDGAGEIGHQTLKADGHLCGCGNHGCLEALSSGTAIARMAREEIANFPESLINKLTNSDSIKINAEIVVKSAMAKDPLAVKIIEFATYYLGIGIANLVNTLNPERIIIGGGVSKAGEMIFEPVRRVVSQRAMKPLAEKVQILPAQLGDEVGIVGAAAIIWQA